MTVDRDQACLFTDNPEYDAFVDKFRPKKTTDDCYTPPDVYDAVRDWACEQYGIDPACIVRPFWPDGDYERFDYTDSAVVLDNPPFSILSQIIEFYLRKNIPFFLFAPTLTAFAGSKIVMSVTHIICKNNITYDNGAKVNTSFVTNLEGDVIARTAPDLQKKLSEANRKRAKKNNKTIKYQYPDHVLTASMLTNLAAYGIDYEVRRDSCTYIRRLDDQIATKKSIYGNGFLLSDKKAAEKVQKMAEAKKMAEAQKMAEAEKMKPHIEWTLSERERKLIEKLK